MRLAEPPDFEAAPPDFEAEPPANLNERLDRIRDELAPAVELERVIVEDLLWGAGRSIACRNDGRAADTFDSDPDWWRSYDRGQRVFHKNLGALFRVRDRRDRANPPEAAPPRPKAKKAAAEPPKPERAPWEEITHRGSRRVEAPPDWPVPVDTPEEIAEAASKWWDVIAYVPSVNDKWALHLPTGKPVEHVLALAEQVGDDRFLRNEPWLRPRDLAAMRACEKLGLHGRFYPMDPTPPGLRRLDAVPPEFLAIREALRAGTAFDIKCLNLPE